MANLAFPMFYVNSIPHLITSNYSKNFNSFISVGQKGYVIRKQRKGV